MERRGEVAVARVRGLLRELASVDSGGRVTRRSLPLERARELLGHDDALFTLLSTGRADLAGAHMRLVVVQGAGEQARVDLIHERLLTGWPTLRKWIAEVAEEKRVRDELRAAALRWDRHGRDPNSLPSGKELAQFLEVNPDPRDKHIQVDYQDALWDKRKRLAAERRWQQGKAIILGGVVLGLCATVVLAVYRRFEMEAMERRYEDRLASAQAIVTRLQHEIARHEKEVSRLVHDLGLRHAQATSVQIENEGLRNELAEYKDRVARANRRAMEAENSAKCKPIPGTIVKPRSDASTDSKGGRIVLERESGRKSSGGEPSG